MLTPATKFHSRSEAAKFLTDRGFKISPKTLAKRATIGGGPSFRKFGRFPLYTEADLLVWAEGRLSAPRRSTSDLHHEDRPSA
jgi:hypothetical protein